MSVADMRPAGLKALFINCTLKRSPEVSNTGGLIDLSRAIMVKHGVEVEVIRSIDHDIAVGVWPDMTEHGWDSDEWPSIHQKVLAADILVLCGPIWLGDNSSVMKKVIERLYACSSHEAGSCSPGAAGCRGRSWRSAWRRPPFPVIRQPPTRP